MNDARLTQNEIDALNFSREALQNGLRHIEQLIAGGLHKTVYDVYDVKFAEAIRKLESATKDIWDTRRSYNARRHQENT